MCTSALSEILLYDWTILKYADDTVVFADNIQIIPEPDKSQIYRWKYGLVHLTLTKKHNLWAKPMEESSFLLAGSCSLIYIYALQVFDQSILLYLNVERSDNLTTSFAGIRLFAF